MKNINSNIFSLSLTHICLAKKFCLLTFIKLSKEVFLDFKFFYKYLRDIKGVRDIKGPKQIMVFDTAINLSNKLIDFLMAIKY
jgi:hypothetical protein